MKKQIHYILAKTPLLVRVVSLYVLTGFVVGVYAYVAPVAQAEPVVTSADVQKDQPIAVEAEAEPVTGVPRRIELPRIGLVHEVIDGYYDAIRQDWTLTDDKTQYATMTSPLSDTSGQTMIYGHNTAAVLEPVKNVVAGDELLITDASGRVFVYTYTSDRFVAPTDAAVLYEKPENPRVVLMTCEGWLSTTRRLLYFDFKEVR